MDNNKLKRYFFLVNPNTKKIEKEIDFEEIKPGHTIAIWDEDEGFFKHSNDEVLYVEDINFGESDNEKDINVTGFSLHLNGILEEFITEAEAHGVECTQIQDENGNYKIKISSICLECYCDLSSIQNIVYKEGRFNPKNVELLCDKCKKKSFRKQQQSKYSNKGKNFMDISKPLENSNAMCGNPYDDLWVILKFKIESSDYCKGIRGENVTPAFYQALSDKCSKNGCKFINICLELRKLRLSERN